MIRIWFLKHAVWFSVLVFLSPVAVWLLAQQQKASADAKHVDIRKNLIALTGDSAERQVFVWYMTGCKPCVAEYPMLLKVDSMARTTGAFSLTVIGLGADTSLMEDKFWRRIKLRKVASETKGNYAAYASPLFYLEGKMEPPLLYPTLVILDKGRLERYHYGGVATWQDLLPEGIQAK